MCGVCVWHRCLADVCCTDESSVVYWLSGPSRLRPCAEATSAHKETFNASRSSLSSLGPSLRHRGSLAAHAARFQQQRERSERDPGHGRGGKLSAAGATAAGWRRTPADPPRCATGTGGTTGTLAGNLGRGRDGGTSFCVSCARSVPPPWTYSDQCGGTLECVHVRRHARLLAGHEAVRGAGQDLRAARRHLRRPPERLRADHQLRAVPRREELRRDHPRLRLHLLAGHLHHARLPVRRGQRRLRPAARVPGMRHGQDLRRRHPPVRRMQRQDDVPSARRHVRREQRRLRRRPPLRHLPGRRRVHHGMRLHAHPERREPLPEPGADLRYGHGHLRWHRQVRHVRHGPDVQRGHHLLHARDRDCGLHRRRLRDRARRLRRHHQVPQHLRRGRDVQQAPVLHALDPDGGLRRDHLRDRARRLRRHRAVPQHLRDTGQECFKDSCCTPTSMATACQGKTCGSVSDGCGGTYACGTCATGQKCDANACCTPMTMTVGCVGKTCGTVSDGCGGTVGCGQCPSSEICSTNTCVACIAPRLHDDPVRARGLRVRPDGAELRRRLRGERAAAPLTAVHAAGETPCLRSGLIREDRGWRPLHDEGFLHPAANRLSFSARCAASPPRSRPSCCSQRPGPYAPPSPRRRPSPVRESRPFQQRRPSSTA